MFALQGVDLLSGYCVGTRCRSRRDCVQCLLLAVQVVHLEADQEAGHRPYHTQRLPLHKGSRIHVHQVCMHSLVYNGGVPKLQVYSICMQGRTVCPMDP